jgi:hypothetical protein
MQVKVRFSMSREIVPDLSNIKIDKYCIESLPNADSDFLGSKNQFLLRFEDEVLHKRKSSNPYRESEMLLSFFSLITQSKLNFEGLSYDEVKNEIESWDRYIYRSYTDEVKSLPDIEKLYYKLNSCEEDIARQFIRACDAYKNALNMIGSYNTLSYFLLCISIECMSNKVIDGNGTCNKFIEFICKYLPDDTLKIPKDEKFNQLLKEVYYSHRSGFTHGGKSLSQAVRMADKMDKPYIKHVVDGKEVLTPSLKWFEEIVNSCLLGYLNSIETNNETIEENILEKFAIDDSVIYMVAKKDIFAGQVIGEDDVQLE